MDCLVSDCDCLCEVLPSFTSHVSRNRKAVEQNFEPKQVDFTFVTHGNALELYNERNLHEKTVTELYENNYNFLRGFKKEHAFFLLSLNCKHFLFLL